MKKYKGVFLSILLNVILANMVALAVTLVVNVQWYAACLIATIVALTLIFIDTLIRTAIYAIGKSK